MDWLRIGLTQRVEVVESYGERRDCLDQAWFPRLEDQRMVPVPVPNALCDPVRYARALELDGLLLTGGNDIEGLDGAKNIARERDRTEHLLIEWAGREGVPVLGVCRGMQMLVLHYGGTLGRVEGHIATCHEVVASPQAPPTFSDALGEGYSEVNSFHGYGLQPDDLGPTLEVMATARDGTVEAVSHPTLRQWGIMWHPERPPERAMRDNALLRGFFSKEQPSS